MKIFEKHNLIIQILGCFSLLIFLCFNTSFTIDLNNNVESSELQYDTLEPVQHVKMLDLRGFKAIQSSTKYGSGAKFAIDGNTDSNFKEYDLFNSVTCTQRWANQWWQVDLEMPTHIDHIIVWNRTDGNVGYRLNNYILEIFDEFENIVFSYRHKHNYEGRNSFVRDTVSRINTIGRYVKIRIETPPEKRIEVLSISEVQIFAFQQDKYSTTEPVYLKSNARDKQLEDSFITIQKPEVKSKKDRSPSQKFDNSSKKRESPIPIDDGNALKAVVKEADYSNIVKDTRSLKLLDITKFTAIQNSTRYGAGAGFAIDGNTNSDFMEYDLFNSVTCTHSGYNPWWQVDLETTTQIDQIIVWNRTDGNVGYRLNNYILEILDENKKVLYSYQHKHNFKKGASFINDIIFPVNISGRYVRIRLETPTEKRNLSIAELQLFAYSK
ncbi:discoidin domain-containing protein [Pseudotenacibaculum sp. MALMAid0570]|uniref:galactose-binding domain-containing protein n=1 Tax=Pseudotenacibaculum sp. MALMAid0570 TaxID=3143938 RepID=UPI0032DFF8BB